VSSSSGVHYSTQPVDDNMATDAYKRDAMENLMLIFVILLNRQMVLIIDRLKVG
jgi:hypothetical protein